MLVSVNQIEDVSKLAYTVASHLALKISEKQELLEIDSVAQRMERIISFMESEIGVMQEGACADLTLFRVTEGDIALEDAIGGKRNGHRTIEHLNTIRGGKIRTPGSLRWEG